jgi:8-oxo-dGTP pyrophosphatase MutT (NUDIX family)
MNTNNRKTNNTNLKKKTYKDYVCTNCGGNEHQYKSCPEPIVSWGMILVSYGKLNRPIHKDVELTMMDMSDTKNRVLIESKDDRFLVSEVHQKIKFLMISRKNSVGYVEFIRGRYRIEMIDQLAYLFRQMMSSELERIKISLDMKDGFMYLWRDFWGAKYDSHHLLHEKTISQTNYMMLKSDSVDGPQLSLRDIVESVKSDYDIPEWGFPKGRKDRFETDKECAKREFREETGYTDDDYQLIPEIKPLVENLIGTNGVKYRHIYYVGELLTDKQPHNNITEFQKNEIGDIMFMDINTALTCIRSYHMSRQILIKNLFTYYIDRIIESNRDREIEVKNEQKTLSVQNVN